MGTVSGSALSRVARNAAFCLYENTFRNSFPFGLIAFDIVSIGYILHLSRRKQPTGNETMNNTATQTTEVLITGGRHEGKSGWVNTEDQARGGRLLVQFKGVNLSGAYIPVEQIKRAATIDAAV